MQLVSHTANTNGSRFYVRTYPFTLPNHTIRPAMSNQTQIDQITERVERLLLRYEELQRTNALLNEQLAVLTHERDSLKSRLGAARARVDALLERLPENSANGLHAPAGTQ